MSRGPYRPGHLRLPSFVSQVSGFLAGIDSPREYLERCISHINELEPEVRAFVHLDLEAARRSADDSTARYRARVPLSPIDGMPVGVKDIIYTRDMPTEMNSPIFTGFQPRRDAACVVSLKQAGAMIIGKTATTEFAAGRSGPTRNPFDLTRTPGGSSSGSAAAVGGGMLPAALGTQTLASILRPASYCGAFGWKPTHDTVSRDGVAPLSRTLDHVGVIAGTVADAWAVVTTIADPASPVQRDGNDGALPAPHKPTSLVKLETAGWDEIDAASTDAFEGALAKLSDEGVAIVDRADPRVDALERRLREAPDVAATIFAWESQWPLRAYQACGDDLIGPRLRELIESASRMTWQDHATALAWRSDLVSAVQALGRDVDGFVSLGSSGPAPRGLEHTGSRTFPLAWSLLGAPSCSLPVLSVSGLPLGLQLMCLAGDDARMIAIARWLIDRLVPNWMGINSE